MCSASRVVTYAAGSGIAVSESLDVQPYDRAARRHPDLDELAQLVGEPQTATVGLVRRWDGSARRVAPRYGRRHGCRRSRCDLDPCPQDAAAATVADAVGRDLVRGEDEIGDPRRVESGLDARSADERADLGKAGRVEGERGCAGRRVRERIRQRCSDGVVVGRPPAGLMVPVLEQEMMRTAGLVDDRWREAGRVVRTQQPPLGVVSRTRG